MTQHEQNMLLIAKAVLKAQSLRNATYVDPERGADGWYTSDGHYTMSWDDAVKQVWNEPIFRPMLYLIASSTYCDYTEWALQVVYRFEQNSDLIPKGWTPFPGYFD